MGIADKVARKATELKERREDESQNGSKGQSSLVLVEPGHIRRLKGVLKTLTGIISESQDAHPLGRMAFLMTTISEEVAEEMREYDEMTMRLFMFQIGEVISWIGHGDNERLPDNVRQFAELIQPTVRNDNTSDGSADTPNELDTVTR
jgi:hypothetical protein